MSASPTSRRIVFDRIWRDAAIRKMFEEATGLEPLSDDMSAYFVQVASGHVEEYHAAFRQWSNTQIDEIMPC